jgi:hypothetical protein
MDVIVGDDLTIGGFGEKVHTVGNDAETQMIAIFVEFLQSSSV